MSLRLISFGLVPQAKLSPGKVTGRKVEAAKLGERKVYFGKEHGVLTTQVYNRDLFELGHKHRRPGHRRAVRHHHRHPPRARSDGG